MHQFLASLVTLFILILVAIAAVLYFNIKARAKAKSLVLSELAIIRSAEARTAAELKAKAAADAAKAIAKL